MYIYVDLIPMITHIRFVFTASIWCFFHAFSCITATSMAPQAALGFSGVVSGGGCCRFCVKGLHFEGLKMLGNISKFKISSNLKVQTLSFSLTWLAHWPFWPNSELSKLHFTHEGMPNTSWIELGATSMMDKQIKVPAACSASLAWTQRPVGTPKTELGQT